MGALIVSPTRELAEQIYKVVGLFLDARRGWRTKQQRAKMKPMKKTKRRYER